MGRTKFLSQLFWCVKIIDTNYLCHREVNLDGNYGVGVFRFWHSTGSVCALFLMDMMLRLSDNPWMCANFMNAFSATVQ